MKTRKLLFVVLLAVPLLMFVAPPPAAGFHPPLPFTTVESGEISYYRYGDADFTGADLRITTKKTWEWFWPLHTAGIDPPPPLPSINFGKDMVIVTILGYQTSGGGPSTQVLEVSADHGCNCLHVLMEDNETPGPLDVITNPYHIIKLRNQPVSSVVFELQKP